MTEISAKDRINHILDAIESIEEFVKEVDQYQFANSQLLQSAVQFQFLIIGEAVKYLDANMLAKYDYPWHIPRSFRNFIIHVYHGIRPERIYFAATDLTSLKSVLQRILQDEFDN